MTNEEVKEFFKNTPVKIHGNPQLREPQREGYQAIIDHFNSDSGPSYIQLPVGCGKTGLMGLAPFGVTVAPNITVRDTILNELDISKPDCFYSQRMVLTPNAGPYISVLKTGANIHDCDNAHIVVANIQQFVGVNNRWYEKLDHDYFQMILVDEGHHNVAESWRRLFDYFEGSKIISFTATPVRSDGQQVEGEKIYSYTYTRAMLMGFISPIDAVYISPSEVSFTAEGKTKTIPLTEVLMLRDQDWFRAYP
jgi:DNA repair protein RadD